MFWYLFLLYLISLLAGFIVGYAVWYVLTYRGDA